MNELSINLNTDPIFTRGSVENVRLARQVGVHPNFTRVHEIRVASGLVTKMGRRDIHE